MSILFADRTKPSTRRADVGFLLPHDEPHAVAVRVARQCCRAKAERQRCGIDRSGRYQGNAMIAVEYHDRIEAPHDERGLPMTDVVAETTQWKLSAYPGDKVVKQ